jgi:hypothetical protein
VIDRYLQITKDAQHDSQIDAIAKELTHFTNQDGFMDAALSIMAHGYGEKEKDTLVSSLIKDKFILNSMA